MSCGFGLSRNKPDLASNEGVVGDMSFFVLSSLETQGTEFYGVLKFF